MDGYNDAKTSTARERLGGQADCAERRMTAQEMLQRRAARLRAEADRLDTLAQALPGMMPMDADIALCELVATASSKS